MTIKFFNDPERLWKLFTLMLDGAGVTLSIFFLTLVFSVPLGMLVAQGRWSGGGWCARRFRFTSTSCVPRR